MVRDRQEWVLWQEELQDIALVIQFLVLQILSAPPVYPYADPYTGPAVTPDQETEMLKEQADLLKQQLEDMQARMEELEKEEKES